MCNHQNDNSTMKLFRSEYDLNDGQQLILRTPIVSDAQGLINQIKSVDHETRFLAREPDEFTMTLEQEQNFISKSMMDEDSQFLLGEIHGKIVATCSVGLLQNKKRYLHRAAMGIAVSKDYWRKGIGKIMMQECIHWCSEKGIEQLELEVITQNKRALAMYEGLGFQIYGTKKHALKYGDGTYGDEYFMILFLDGLTR